MFRVQLCSFSSNYFFSVNSQKSTHLSRQNPLLEKVHFSKNAQRKYKIFLIFIDGHAIFLVKRKFEKIHIFYNLR